MGVGVEREESTVDERYELTCHNCLMVLGSVGCCVYAAEQRRKRREREAATEDAAQAEDIREHMPDIEAQ